MADPLTMALPELQLGLSEAQPVARFNLRCRDREVAACSDALRLDLPTRPCTSAENGGRSALWLGPDEWLILASGQDDPTSHLTAAMGDRFFSWVDISARQVGLVLTGPESARPSGSASSWPSTIPCQPSPSSSITCVWQQMKGTAAAP